MILSTSQIQIIQDQQQQAIKLKTLTKEQLLLIQQANWFNIWVPKKYKGLEYTLVEGIKLLEEIAYWDGGLGWTITLCSGANMFAGFINPEMALKVFSDPKVCFGGSGRIAGKAIWDGEQFTITGTWPYATGAPHLSHFTLNTSVYDEDVQRLDTEGNPVVYSFFVPREHALVHYDWDTFGLECTASHSFSLDQVKLYEAYSFQLDLDHKQSDSKLYDIPFMSFAELTLLANYIGMYRRFLDLVEKYFFDKSKDSIWSERYSKVRFRFLDSFQVKLDDQTKWLHENSSKLWLDSQDTVLMEHIATESRAIVQSIRQAVLELYPLVGIQGAQKEQELNIVFRNIFTASQHSLLNVI